MISNQILTRNSAETVYNNPVTRFVSLLGTSVDPIITAIPPDHPCAELAYFRAKLFSIGIKNSVTIATVKNCHTLKCVHTPLIS